MQEWERERTEGPPLLRLRPGPCGRRKPHYRLAAQLVPFQAMLEWTGEQRRHLPVAGRVSSATADQHGPSMRARVAICPPLQ